MHGIKAQGGLIHAAVAVALAVTVVVALALAAVIGHVSIAGAAPSAAQYQYFTFVGSWTATEPDGTTDTLNVSGGSGNDVNVTYVEESANLCGGNRLIARGPGTIAGGTLTTSLMARCRSEVSGPYEITWRDLGDGTITEGYLIWQKR